jgi:hypothetical protein
VERFLTDLADVARQADPDGLVTYASYPPTEYLDLSFLDFAVFNVYLHDPAAFHRYLFRLQNLVGDKPLVLGELGMDTLRHGEPEQARFLAGHLREAALMGLAGSFVFSWTDDWTTGGHAIADWAFGITRSDRSPKASYHALGEVYRASPAALLAETPRVSVVVCTYNGAATLEQCLGSLAALDYPDYEIIVVDDGSTDEYRTRLFGDRGPVGALPTSGRPRPLPWTGKRTAAYWSETGPGRLELLRRVIHHLDLLRWGKTLDSGWSDWDLEIHCHRWTVVRVSTAEEDHGGGKRLIRVRYSLRPGGYLDAAGVVAALAGAGAAWLRLWPVVAAAGGLLAAGLFLWWRGTRAAARAVALFDQAAADLGALAV